MNILFVLKTLEIGGVEVVTSVLANKFSLEGHHVYVFAFSKGEHRTIDSLSDSVKVFTGNGFNKSNGNKSIIHKILVEGEIDVVVNQWGLPLTPIKVINKARKGLKTKVISVFHNDPLQNGRIQSVATEIAKTENVIKKTLLGIKKIVFRCITGYAMGYIYRHSDRFEVLSPSFVVHFKQFTKIRNTNRLVVQTNPVTLNNEGYVYDAAHKKKEIVYVGRIDYTQKRVHRIIETWAQLEKRFPSWQMTIIGDGEERENIERMVKDLELSRVKFEGFQQPRLYYERASILILASEFEGFPLVLAECMSFGVVPVVYGSYSAVYDIIENGKDGVIIEKTPKGFNAAIMAENMAELMSDNKNLNEMALFAIEKSKDFSIDKIYGQWMGIMNKLQ